VAGNIEVVLASYAPPVEPMPEGRSDWSEEPDQTQVSSNVAAIQAAEPVARIS
jgi:hypothetical protein